MLDSIRRAMHPLSISEALDFVQSIPGHTVKTKAWFSTPVNMLIDVAGDIPVTQLTSRHIREWQKIVEHEPSKQTGKIRALHTQDSYKRALHSFVNHLKKARHLPADSALNDEIRFKRLPYPEAKSLTDDEVELLLNVSKKSKRDHAMIHVLRASGIRIGGLHSMRMSEIEIEEVNIRQELEGEQKELVDLADALGLKRMIKTEFLWQYRGRFLVEEKKTVGKMNVRWARLDDAACRALLAYMEVRPRIGGEAVWLNQNHKPISQNGIYLAFKRVCGRAGVDASPHDLRHTFCRNLLAMGYDLNTVAKLSGHRDPMVLGRIYGVARNDEVDAAYENFARANRRSIQGGER